VFVEHEKPVTYAETLHADSQFHRAQFACLVPVGAPESDLAEERCENHGLGCDAQEKLKGGVF